MSHQATPMVSNTRTSNSRSRLNRSECRHRTSSTLRLLPLPCSVVLDISTSFPSGNDELDLDLLEVETNFCRQRARGHVMCSAECRQEVVERVFVGNVYAGKANAP